MRLFRGRWFCFAAGLLPSAAALLAELAGSSMVSLVAGVAAGGLLVAGQALRHLLPPLRQLSSVLHVLCDALLVPPRHAPMADQDVEDDRKHLHPQAVRCLAFASYVDARAKRAPTFWEILSVLTASAGSTVTLIDDHSNERIAW